MNSADHLLKVFLQNIIHRFFTSQRYFGPILFGSLMLLLWFLWRDSDGGNTFWWFWLYTLSALFQTSSHLSGFSKCLFSPQKPRGEMENIPAIMDEVKSMFGLGPETLLVMNYPFLEPVTFLI